MHPGSNHNSFLQHSVFLASLLIISIVSVVLFSSPVSAAEQEAVYTVSGQELPDEVKKHDQEESKDDENSSNGSSEIYNPEVYSVSGTDDSFNVEENEMLNELLARLDRLIELLTPEEPETAAVNAEDINVMYPDGYQDWPYPVRAHYRITYDGYTSESAVDCGSPEDFETSYRSNVMCTLDGAFQSFYLWYVLALDENSELGDIVYDYDNPVHLASEEPEDTEDEEKKELSFAELLSDVKSIDEKLSDMQEENQQLSVSGNDLISGLDDTIQKGNEENRQMITDLFTQGTTYILAFIGIVVGVIVGVILSRYLKHD